MTQELHFPARLEAGKDDLAMFIKVIDVDTGQDIGACVAADTAEGWADVMTGGREITRKKANIRFEVMDDAPDWVLVNLKLRLDDPARDFI